MFRPIVLESSLVPSKTSELNACSPKSRVPPPSSDRLHDGGVMRPVIVRSAVGAAWAEAAIKKLAARRYRRAGRGRTE
ncbi:hypothetical protein D3C80_1635730 [compost metagenome]